MLKELFERVLDAARPEIVEVNGHAYSTSRLNLVHDYPAVTPIEIHSLTGVIDYINSEFDHSKRLLIHIESPTQITLKDALDNTNDRRIYLKSTALLPIIMFDNFIDREQFQIMLQANFVPTDDLTKVMNIISHINISDGNIELKDSGFTQTVTVKTGAATLSAEPIPPKVLLKPFRTFVEVPQPPSEYILRLNERGRVALFEADGGAWKLEAIEHISEFFKVTLADKVESGKVFVLR